MDHAGQEPGQRTQACDRFLRRPLHPGGGECGLRGDPGGDRLEIVEEVILTTPPAGPERHSPTIRAMELAAAFPPAERERWRELLKGVLRKSGAATEDTPLDAVEGLLTKLTYDGV